MRIYSCVCIFRFDLLLTLNNIPSVSRKSMRLVQVQMRQWFSILLQVLQKSFLLVSPWEQVAQKEKHWWWVRKGQKRLLLAQYEPSSPKVKTWVVNVTKIINSLRWGHSHRINGVTAMRKAWMGPTQRRTVRRLLRTFYPYLLRLFLLVRINTNRTFTI